MVSFPPAAPAAPALAPPPAPEHRTLSPEERALQHDVRKGRRAVERILGCGPTQLRSRAFLLDCVQEFGILNNDWALLEDYKGALNVSKFGVAQIPTEFTDFLLLVARHRPASYLEIGSWSGGTGVLAAAYLSRHNPDFRMTCVDIENAFLDYAHYSSVLPLRLDCPATSGDYVGQEFDVAFIDGDHSYNGALQDYLRVGRAARVCAMHDIKGHEYNHLNGGTVRLWGEAKNHTKKTHTVVEISHSRPDWMGIGVIIREQAA